MIADHLFPIWTEADLVGHSRINHGTGGDPRRGHCGDRVGSVNSFDQTGRWCEGDRGGRHYETSGGEDDLEASCEAGRESHSSFPARLDQSRMRVHGPHPANHHGQG